jgi:D-glycero-D-manno-heptose 1,7-bisphosphate phosphatase
MNKNHQNSRIVILDRDGVINEDSAEYIKNPREWIPIDGSLEAIALLHKNGYRVYIATNQAGIARGKLTESQLLEIHKTLQLQVSSAGGRISGIHYCPHHPDDNCPSRKPLPGMLIKIGVESGVDFTDLNVDVAFVGDSLKDLQAAEAAGCRPVLVLTGNGIKTRQEVPRLTHVFSNLLAFAKNEITL